MLDLHYLPIDYGVSYGSVALKSLQNENVPDLDLLVREAVQNSSDASLCEDGDAYSVSFNRGTFVPAELNKFLTGIEDSLNERYRGSSAEYLEIRDTGTCGLTGTLRKEEISDDHGNFFKLIFDTGKKQTNESAGGNWGFGKSVYYRVGIGIVVFYTRIRARDSYENRLIVTMIEDEGKRDADGKDATVLGPLVKDYAGKAWWGIKEGKNLLPLTDMELIRSILDVFEVKEFVDDETGTSIIIPYIDSKRLLDATVPVKNEQREDSASSFESTFSSSLSNYLRLALQKWYAPKIQNLTLKNLSIEPESKKYLRAYVDRQPLRRTDMFRFFRLVQELYTTALARANDDEYVSEEFPAIEKYEVGIKTFLQNGSKAGCVALIRIDKAEISNIVGELSPYDYIGKSQIEGNDPIVMYAREPGMVIDYETAGPWVSGIDRPEKSDECLFAFFVPRTKNRTNDDPSYGDSAGISLGAYLRKCEASDHMDWKDQNRIKIVDRIQKGTVRQINASLDRQRSNPQSATSSRLSDQLGKRLLPPMMSDAGSSGGGGSGQGRSATFRMFNIDDAKMDEDSVFVDFTLRIPAKGKRVSIFPAVKSEAALVDSESWRKTIGIDFPIRMDWCAINSIALCGERKAKPRDYRLGSDGTPLDNEEIFAELSSRAGDGVRTELTIETKIPISEIKGRVALHVNDKKYEVRFLSELRSDE